jgi:hypothetical protein
MDPALADRGPGELTLEADGACRVEAAFGPAALAALEAALAPHPRDRPGARLGPAASLAALLAPAHAIAFSLLGGGARPVRALLLDKGDERNWSLGWHQDRTIALRRQMSVPGFTGWTLKSGIIHAVPPFALLERMLTLRIHVDAAGPGNGPLRIVPGSHRLGRIAERDVEAVAARLGAFTCPAEAGDIWVYSAPILHASDRAAAGGRRRVLQLSYSADPLPGGLEWLGI